jgi:hypothetical protein
MTVPDVLGCSGLDASGWSAVAAVASAAAAFWSARIAAQQRDLILRQNKIAHIQAQTALLEPRLKIHEAAVRLLECVRLDQWDAGRGAENPFVVAQNAFVVQQNWADALFDAGYLVHLHAVDELAGQYHTAKFPGSTSGGKAGPGPTVKKVSDLQEKASELLPRVRHAFERQARVFDEEAVGADRPPTKN